MLLLLALVAVTAAANDSNDSNNDNDFNDFNNNDNHQTLQKSWTLFHSFGGTVTDFTKRGTIYLSVDENAAGVAKDPAAAVTMRIENEVVGFSPADVEAMLEHGWYQLKIVPDDKDSSKSSSSVPAVRTSVPACQLRRANFR